MSRPLPLEFYRRPAEEVAPDLLGRLLVRSGDDGTRALRIVEVEAYLGAPDAASHARGGLRSRRNASLYLDGGHVYVYLIYGIHHCMNVVSGRAGTADAVLIRAGEPVEGPYQMRLGRDWQDRAVRPGDLAGGPGKLCQALGVDLAVDGLLLDSEELYMAGEESVAAAEIVRGPRVGVERAGEAAAWPLRFAIAGNPHVSKPWPWASSRSRP